MTLAKEIIYGHVAGIKQLIEEGARVDEIDEYGYTPLIETAIVNDLEKTKVILEAGADVNFTDLTGRTALHWAADNDNVKLAKLLLKHGADANAYTRAGQSVLVMPFLRNFEKMKRALYAAGADLTFAQDFINAKLLGHRFDLSGRVDIVNQKGTFIEVEFEGFYLEFTLALMVKSLTDFINNFGGKHLRIYFPYLHVIIKLLRQAHTLIYLQHYLIDEKKLEKRINRMLKESPLILPVAYSGHAVTFVKYGTWLLRCDRGAYGKEHGTVIIYRIGQPSLLTTDLMKQLLYERQPKEFIEDGIVELLELKTIGQLPLAPQLSGNCSWANVEATIPAVLFVLLLDQAKRDSNHIDIDGIQQESIHFYEEWLAWDKHRALYFCLNSFNEAEPARKAAKAAILAAILFQSLDAAAEADREQAEKIITALMDPDYQYILEAYLTVAKTAAEPGRFANLKDLLEEHGVDPSLLLNE